MRLALGAVLVLLAAGCSDPQLQTAPPVATPTAGPTTPAPPTPWDPRGVDDLTHAAKDVVPGLPVVVDPPAHVLRLEAKPMSAAVMSVKRPDGLIQLLGVDGSWREVRTAERYPRESLSPDGLHLVALLSDGLELWDLPTGERTTMPLPTGFRPWDFGWVSWIDESTVLLDDYAGGWLLDVESGAAARTPYPRWNSGAWTIDDDGEVLEVADPSEPPAILDWSGGSPRRTDLPADGHLQGVRVRGDTVVGTAYDDRGFALVSFDRSDPTAVHRLPVGDFEGNYSNWALRSAAVLPDSSGLLWIAVPGPAREDGWRLVRWTPASDRLEIVTTSESDPTWPITFARDLLVPQLWNPRQVDDLPPAPDDLMPALPAVLDVPSSTPELAADPVDAAVLSYGTKGALTLLGVDGRWRHVAPAVVDDSVELTRDGTRLLVSTDDGVDVWDLGTGTRMPVPFPAGYQRSDYVTWQWLDDRYLLLDGSWRVDTETGAARRGRVPEGPYDIDDAGEIYRSDWGGPLTLLQVRGDTVAGIGWSDRTQSLAVTVADRSDGATRNVLAVQDDGQTTYGNGGLSVQALLNDGTVLLRVLEDPGPRASIRFVAWEPSTDELSLVMRTRGVLPGWSVAVDLLG